ARRPAAEGILEPRARAVAAAGRARLQARPRRNPRRALRTARLPDGGGAGRSPTRPRPHRVFKNAARLRARLPLARGDADRCSREPPRRRPVPAHPRGRPVRTPLRRWCRPGELADRVVGGGTPGADVRAPRGRAELRHPAAQPARAANRKPLRARPLHARHPRRARVRARDPDLLHASAERHADRPAVTDVRSGRSLTYGALARDAGRVTALLTAQGVQPGQRIGLLAPNAPAYLPAAFGLLSTGACLVPIATNLTPAERAQVLSEVDVNGCLSWSESEGFVFSWMNRDAEGPAELRGLEPAFIRFTSGTTDRSKGVVLSHEATAHRVAAADRVLRFTPDDRILWVLPLAYHFAVTIVAYVKAGAHILMCPDTRPPAMVDALRRFETSVIYASPLHFERLRNRPPTRPPQRERLTRSTRAPKP